MCGKVARQTFSKILLVLICIVLLLGSCPTFVYAEYGTIDEHYLLSDSDPEHIVSGCYAPSPDKCASYVAWLSTPLRGGNTYEAVCLDWVPIVKDLAAGVVPGDRFTWKFEDAPFYVDAKTKKKAESRFDTHTWNMQPKMLSALVCEALIGIYDIYELEYDKKIRKIGDNTYRCAMVGVSVKTWRSPYGGLCSRDSALAYYEKCQKQTEFVVSKLRTVRQSNGKELTDVQKLKWIHDWLINGVDYAYEERNEYAKGYGFYSKLHIFNEYGAIVDGRAVCQSYAYAFKAIVDELVRQTGIDIECEEVHNKSHSWNRVKIDGKWYHVDATWDDSGESDFFNENISTKFFLFSDSRYSEYYSNLGKYNSHTSLTEKSTDSRYEDCTWPRYKKDLSECTVYVFPYGGDFVYETEDIFLLMELRYGTNVLPRNAYQFIRTNDMKAGRSEIKVMPTKECVALNGEIDGPTFKVFKGDIDGSAKSTVKYKLGRSKEVRPFDEEFAPFASDYEYEVQLEALKFDDENLVLKRGTDYTVRYEHNNKPGWATAFIRMKGSYTGEVKVRYRIIR